MGKYRAVTINLPEIKKPFTCCRNVSYSTPSTKKYNIEMVKSVNNQYGNLFQYWGDIFEIPKGILIGFCCIESGGEMSKPNRYKATGLMQVTPQTIYGNADLVDWKKDVKSEMPKQAVDELNSKIPGITGGKTLASLESKILNKLQYDANFNIMAGTLTLRWNIERFKQLNKAVVAYNAGAYNRTLVSVKDQIIDSTTLFNMPIPKESKAYLLKLFGVDSYLSIIYSDKVI